MKTTLKYLSFLILFINISLSGYCQIKIHGFVKNYPDNTKVVLANTSSGEPLDTTYIKNEEFSFKTSSEDTLMFGIFIDNPDIDRFGNEMAVFFIEDEDIEISGEKGNLKYANVSGGNIQNQANSFNKTIELYSRHFDKLNAMGFEAYEKKQTFKLDSINKIQDEIIQKRIDIGLQYIADHPTHFFSLLRLQSSMPLMSVDVIARAFQQLDDNLKRHRIGKYIESVINEKQLKVGDVAPNFELANINGQNIKLSDFKGRYVLINFWASYCGSCRLENKNLLTNYKEFHSKGFDIISISGDKDRDKWINASERDSVIWHNLIENSVESSSGKYNVLLIPTNFLIDPNGKLIEKNLKGDALRKKLFSIFM